MRVSRVSRGLYRSMSSKVRAGPVRLVLLDVFDTLCTPRLPIHEQYYEEAISAGILPRSITPDSVRSAFKPAFKEMDATWPLYGKHTDPPLTPEEWWTNLISRCIVNAGAEAETVDRAMSHLGPALLRRFESDVGYRNFPETLGSLDALRDLGVKVSVVSNADPRICWTACESPLMVVNTLSALGILPRLTTPPTLSWGVEASKPDAKIFQAACRACGEEPGQGVLMVGDELEADYRGSVTAGLDGRLIRRQGEWSDGAKRTGGEDLTDVRVIQSLDDIVEEVRSRNQR